MVLDSTVTATSQRSEATEEESPSQNLVKVVFQHSQLLHIAIFLYNALILWALREFRHAYKNVYIYHDNNLALTFLCENDLHIYLQCFSWILHGRGIII